MGGEGRRRRRMRELKCEEKKKAFLVLKRREEKRFMERGCMYIYMRDYCACVRSARAKRKGSASAVIPLCLLHLVLFLSHKGVC